MLLPNWWSEMTLPKTIHTERLVLLALPEERLRSYLAGGSAPPDEAQRISREILTPALRKAIELKLDKFSRCDLDDWLWFTYWLIKVPPQAFGAGLIGYKGPPNSSGEVEVGYGIDPRFQSQGYTTEALEGMTAWAFSDPRCQRILAPETLRTNPASNRVLQKAGFRIYAETAESISWCLDRRPGVVG